LWLSERSCLESGAKQYRIWDFGLDDSIFNPQSKIGNRQGSNRFCAIHCGTACGCWISGSFAPSIFFQNGGDVSRLAICGAGAGFVVFFALGVTAATVLCHADFVPAATLCAPFFTDCIGDVLGGAGAFSTQGFFFGSVLAVPADLLDKDFDNSGMCNLGQLTFFLGVLTIQWPLSAGLVGICASYGTGPAPSDGAVADGMPGVVEGNGV
jgi:hypothetical protein